jgi:hypothetical protein
MSKLSSKNRTSSCCALGLGILASLTCAASAFSAQDNTTQPNFAPTANISWAPIYQEFMPPASGPGPVMADPAHPYITNQEAAAKGIQPTFQVGDVNSPILQPWAKEEVRKRNEATLAGRAGLTRSAKCWPLGVPAFLLYQVLSTYIVQTPEKVLMISTQDHQVRQILLNRQHSENVKPSWFGESVGHYEGDTLVVDTVGINDKTYIDHYRTPHTDKLHVVERFRLVDNGMTLEANVHVEDTGAFTTPWNAIQRFRRTERDATQSPTGTIGEYYCAENPTEPFPQDPEQIPHADKPDF